MFLQILKLVLSTIFFFWKKKSFFKLKKLITVSLIYMTFCYVSSYSKTL